MTRLVLTWLISGLGTLGSLAWISVFLQILRHGRKHVPQIRDLPEDSPESGWPGLTVAFAARNEATNVEAATRSLLAQNYPDLTIVAVDDRSTDETGAILDRLCAEDNRLRVVHIAELPLGWLGKNNALQNAADATKTEWLLLTDADVIFAPGTLRRTMAWAVANRLDHVTVAPDNITETFGERVFLAMFSLAFAMRSPAWRVRDDRRKDSLGIGAFNLVRLEAFRAVGGFRRLALSIDDDMRLGQALKYAGYRPGFLFAKGAISLRWQVGAIGMIRGIEKNFFAALDFKLAAVFLGLITLLAVGVFPHVGVFVGPWWTRAVCLAGVLSIVGLLQMGEGQHGVRWYHGLFLPLGAVMCVVALLRSTYRTLRDRGVRWRNHLYPLDELRRHVRYRNEWLTEVWRSTR